MPELPDVEVQRRRLEATSLGRGIEGVWVDRRTLDGPSARRLRDALRGRALEETRRHGKWLLARAGDAGWLCLHFGMTGRLDHAPDGASEEAGGHPRLRLDLADGSRLVLDARRNLARVDLADDPAALARARDLGPDALGLGRDDLVAMAAGRRGGVKAFLMDQSALAGVGNIYSDEILFRARTHPKRTPADLGERGARRLHRALGAVLRTAIERGADPGRLPRGWLLHRREEGASCPRCDGRVERLHAAGRSAYLCPRCQT